jgi:hypothetical protein
MPTARSAVAGGTLPAEIVAKVVTAFIPVPEATMTQWTQSARQELKNTSDALVGGSRFLVAKVSPRKAKYLVGHL